MDVSLSPAQSAVRERYAELVSDELVPSIRRMAEMPRGGGAVGGGADDADPNELADVRGAVWQALVGLGATRALLPEPYCTPADRVGHQGAVIIAELLGTALYQGPLFDTMTAGELLARVGDRDGKLLGEIAEGAAVTLAPRESAVDTHARPGPITLSGEGPETVTARRRFVGFADDADYLLVLGAAATESGAGVSAGAGESGLVFALVPVTPPRSRCAVTTT